MNLFSENVSPLLTAEKLKTLKNHKIVTALDFVQYNNDKIANLIECNVSEIIKIKDVILTAHNCKPIRADKWCDMNLRTSDIFESGIKKVDEFLGGAIQTGRLTEVYGDSCSGKSQLAFQLSANASINRSFAVCYLTSGETNPKRIFQIMQNLKKDGDYVKGIERITFTHVTDVYKLLDLLWAPEMSRYNLVVIDSLATIFSPLLGDSSNDAISLLNKVASDLKRLAVVQRCAVLIVNHVSRWTSRPISETTTTAPSTPSLGRYWMSVPNVRLYTKRLSNNQFELTIVRNVYCPDRIDKCSFSYFENIEDERESKPKLLVNDEATS